MSAFDKVIGYEDIKVELERYCDVLKNPERYGKLGVKVPSGILLHGDPGLGKTLMAKCFIEESGLKTFTIRKDKPDGAFVNAIRETFEKARAEAPSIVFLDDMDKFANEDDDHKNAEEYITIQAQIDENKGRSVFVIATANEKFCLPDSLLRVGRFDKEIEITTPQGEESARILGHYLESIRVVKDLNLDVVARLVEGHSCAELEGVINEAGIYAGYEGRDIIEQDDLVKAGVRLLFGSTACMKAREGAYAERIAVHEAGHAVLAEILNPGTVNAVTICKFYGSKDGLVSYRKAEEENFSKEFKEKCVIRSLGGKAATEIVYGVSDVGCNSDLNNAFHKVRCFIDNWCTQGFDAFELHNVSEYLLETRDRIVAAEMEKYYQTAKRLLIENRSFLDTVVAALIEKQTLTCEDIRRIREEKGIVRAEPYMV